MKNMFALGLLSIALMHGVTSAAEARPTQNPVRSYEKTIRIEDKTQSARDFFDKQQRNGS